MRRWQVERPGSVVLLGVLAGPALAGLPAIVLMIVYGAVNSRGIAAALQDINLSGIVAAPFQLALLAIPAMLCGVIAGFIPGFFSACLLLVFSGLRGLTYVEEVMICVVVSALFGLLVSRMMIATGTWEPVVLFGFAGAVGAVAAGLIARRRGIVVPLEPVPDQATATP